MPKLNPNHLRGLMLGCGVLLLGLGAARGFFHLTLDDRLERWLSNGLFIVAALAFLQMRRLQNQAREAAKKP